MRKPVIIVFCLVLFASLSWLALDRPGQEGAAAPDSAPRETAPETQPVVDFVAPKAARRAAQTMADATSPQPVDPDVWQVVEYGDFVSVREYRRRCKAVINVLGAGEGDEVTTCERKFEFDHPYALFTDAQLAQIASTDGEAAFILAHRQLYPAEPGGTQDIEAGVNNVLDAMIRGAEGQALDLLLDEAVFSPHSDLRSFLLWSMVGERLDIASPAQIERMLIFKEATTLDDIEAIEHKAAEIADLLRQQRLIVLGTEF